ncbi:MAG: alpha-amylase [Gemmataceae bacterium]
MPIHFVFGVHNHQPVGNFHGVFEQMCREAYEPFLELVAGYPELKVTLHISGPLLEWLLAHRRAYVDKLRCLVDRGRVEILGGAFHEPVLPMIPRRDRIGQIRDYAVFLRDLFGQPIRGMWVAERVWEPGLVADLAEAGVEYTLLDDFHFRQAGLDSELLLGHFLTEDEGRLVKVFPISEPLRYLVPWKDPQEALAWLAEVHRRHPDAVVVCADDGEKFGGWPETHRHCYTDRWLARFFDLVQEQRSWIRCVTLAEAAALPAVDRIYLPDCSYREMMEWALPPERLEAYQDLIHSLAGDPRAATIQSFLRGGTWRNFRVKYPEVQEMYCRMLEASDRLQTIEQRRTHTSGAPGVTTQDADLLRRARRHVYRAQCNCAYWHGAFGGLYLPHLRHAVFAEIIAADRLLDRLDDAPPCYAEVRDFDLDGQEEICLRNPSVKVYVRPSAGGSVYQFDLLKAGVNLLGTLSRRREAYHRAILAAATGVKAESAVSKLLEQARFKQPGLERLLYYDRYLRKALLDHFYPLATTLDDLVHLQERDLADTVVGAYHYRVGGDERCVQVELTRDTWVAEMPVRVTKSLRVPCEGSVLKIHYCVEPARALPQEVWFAVEWNVAGLAAGADDRYYRYPGRPHAGQLQTEQDVPPVEWVGVVDEWLGVGVELRSRPAAAVWAWPIQTVSQSEGGFELVYQSSCIVPHWRWQGRGKFEADLELIVSQTERDL